MQESSLPLELISNFISIVVLIIIFLRYFQYKKKIDVIKGLGELKKQKQLSQGDKDFIEKNYKEYSIEHNKTQALLKLVFPLFITVAAVLIFLLSLQEALIHLNVVVVVFIYLHVKRIHSRNFVSLLEELKS